MMRKEGILSFPCEAYSPSRRNMRSGVKKMVTKDGVALDAIQMDAARCVSPHRHLLLPFPHSAPHIHSTGIYAYRLIIITLLIIVVLVVARSVFYM